MQGMNPLQMIILFLFISVVGIAQQDAMFTKYMFNALPFNPSIAGTTEALDMTLLHRHQWFGIQGAPMTQQFSIHSPIRLAKKNDNASVGGFLSHDQLGFSRTVMAYGVFSYKLRLNNPIEKKNIIHLNLGLSGGISNWSANYEDLQLDNSNDPSFQNLNPNVWMPNFGFGMYLHSRNWFVGLSAPRLLTNPLRSRGVNEPAYNPIAQEFRHYYLAVGGAIEISQDIVLRPSLLIKNVGLFVEKSGDQFVGAPTQFNIDLSVLLLQRFWVGTSFRSSVEVFTSSTSSYDSIDFWFGMRLSNGIKFGLSYDFTLTSLQGPGLGSYEVMLGYDLHRNATDMDGGNVIDPRYLTF